MSKFAVQALLLVSFLPQMGHAYLLNTDNCNDVICYFSNDAPFRRGKARFLPEDIDPLLCTHIHYFYARIRNGRVEARRRMDQDRGRTKGLYSRVLALKDQKPGLRVLLTVGTWHTHPGYFKDVSWNSDSLGRFATAAIRYVRAHGFDGIDLFWPYRSTSNFDDNSREHLHLLQALRNRIRQDKQTSKKEQLWLAASLRAGVLAPDAYDIGNIYSVIDYGLIHTYSYHGPWERRTGHNAPYLPLHPQDKACVKSSTEDFVENGFREPRLFVGLPTFGRSFTLKNPAKRHLHSPASIGGHSRWTGLTGILTQFEICELERVTDARWVPDSHGTSLVIAGNQWISYDTPAMTAQKLKRLKFARLSHGFFVYTIDMDDFTGVACDSAPFRLTRVLNACFHIHLLLRT